MNKFTHNTEAYNTIRQDYKQYTLNATQAGEHIMFYAKWLEKYRGVCSEGVDMLIKKGQNEQRFCKV